VASRRTKTHPLRRWRARNGVTSYEVADLSGLSPALISMIESGQRNPGPKTKIAISRALGVRVRDVFPTPEHSTDDEVAETLATEGLA
jgi:transcriptional regulator with XRE-family HTH domain